MKFKLSFFEPNFYVNEKKKTVTCVMKYVLKLNQDAPNKSYEFETGLKYISDYYLNEEDNAIRYRFTVTDVAKLDPHDTFDVETGKKVARAKAESSAYRHMSKILNRVYGKFIDDLAAMTNEFTDKAESVIEHNNKYLAKF